MKLQYFIFSLLSFTSINSLATSQQYDNYYYSNNNYPQQYSQNGNTYPNRGGPAPYGTEWDFQESWRHDKQAYFNGETQPQAWRKAHPYGPGGIGYDPAPEYVRASQNQANYQNQRANNNVNYQNASYQQYQQPQRY